MNANSFPNVETTMTVTDAADAISATVALGATVPAPAGVTVYMGCVSYVDDDYEENNGWWVVGLYTDRASAMKGLADEANSILEREDLATEYGHTHVDTDGVETDWDTWAATASPEDIVGNFYGRFIVTGTWDYTIEEKTVEHRR